MDGLENAFRWEALFFGALFIVCFIASAIPLAAQSPAEIDREGRIAELFDYLYGEEALEAGERDAVREGIREKLRLSPGELGTVLSVDVPAAFQNEEKGPIESIRAEGGIRETAINASSDVEAEIHAAINPTDSNNIVVGVITMFSAGGGLGADATTTIYYTHDFGHTWNRSNTTFRSTGFDFVVGGGDPMFAFDAEGRLYYSWIDLTIDAQFRILNAMSWASSSDGGKTWRQEVNDRIGEGILTNGGSSGEMFDKQWMVVDRTGSERHGRVYVGLVHSNRGGTMSGGMGIRTKVEGTEEFVDYTARVPGENWAYNQLASTAVDPEGKLHMMFFGSRLTDPGDMALWLSGSVDGGESMLPARRITDIQVPVFSTGQESERILGFRGERTQPSSHLAVDLSEGPNRGNLYAVWSANGLQKKGTSRNDIWFMRSTDRGATWSNPMIVNDDEDAETSRGQQDQFHPSISVNNLGVITLSWYDRRDDPQNRLTHYYMAHSFDGGLSFSENYRVSSEPSNFASIGDRNNGFGVGEYVQTVSTDGYAIPIWSDGRKNSGDIDVYVAFVPIGGTSSVAERSLTLDSDVSIVDLHPRILVDQGEIGLKSSGRIEAEIDLVSTATGVVVTQVFNGDLSGGYQRIPLYVADLPAGIYILRVETRNGLAHRKITIRR
jgi:hypothetical protein